ncbi:DUF3080 family protein [Pseudoalteromonas piscicida]|uniref:DUF3080 family protein n=1 Tax=Pseudoalteromonas piscicida TaxID=43662 RepID=UPI001F5BC2B4|nr:DUF3080 family protein [Pseudoalteromonas piscicida]
MVKLAPLKNSKIEKISKPQSNLSISILDIAQTGHCKVTQLIAAQNNQLGKVSYPSERLKYAVEFIKSAPQCINSAETKDELKQILTEAVLEKRHQLPWYFLHMMTFEKELSNLGMLTTEEVPLEAPAIKGKSLEAVNILADFANNIHSPEKISTATLTPALAILSKRYISSLLTSVRKQTMLNNATTQQLEQLVLKENMCRDGGNRKQANIVSNVFTKYYLSQLQPYQAMLTASMEELIQGWQPIHQLYQEHSITDPLTLHEHLDNLKRSAKNHVKWWQNFYDLCEITPL